MAAAQRRRRPRGLEALELAWGPDAPLSQPLPAAAPPLTAAAHNPPWLPTHLEAAASESAATTAASAAVAAQPGASSTTDPRITTATTATTTTVVPARLYTDQRNGVMSVLRQWGRADAAHARGRGRERVGGERDDNDDNDDDGGGSTGRGLPRGKGATLTSPSSPANVCCAGVKSAKTVATPSPNLFEDMSSPATGAWSAAASKKRGGADAPAASSTPAAGSRRSGSGSGARASHRSSIGDGAAASCYDPFMPTEADARGAATSLAGRKRRRGLRRSAAGPVDYTAQLFDLDGDAE